MKASVYRLHNSYRQFTHMGSDVMDKYISFSRVSAVYDMQNNLPMKRDCSDGRKCTLLGIKVIEEYTQI